jgi:alkanesulfonate monooxygenase SsuD/methylene tetrahydromethanopterin reductase-like flavin-dependent oxidoreductase (luciferase family)
VDFSTMVLSMWVDADDDPARDESILRAAVDQSLLAGQLGFNPWYTEHHFRGPWHSAPLEFAAYIAPQLPPERRLGFGVLGVPHHHPVRLVEQMNLLHQLTKGRALFGVGSGFRGIEPAGAGLDEEYHASGRATRDSLEVMERLWDFQTGDAPYEFRTPAWRGRVVKRIAPAPYRRRRPMLIRTARTDEATVDAARRGSPVFLGTFGVDLDAQLPLYRSALDDTGHPPEVVEECLRWSTVDWLSVVVAERDEDAPELVARARAEQAELRNRFLAQMGQPVLAPDDTIPAIAGGPETIAEHVGDLRDKGVNHLLLRFLGEWHGSTRWISEQSMRVFSERVMPLFANGRPSAGGARGAAVEHAHDAQRDGQQAEHDGRADRPGGGHRAGRRGEVEEPAADRQHADQDQAQRHQRA